MSDPLNDQFVAALNKQISDPRTRQQLAMIAAAVTRQSTPLPMPDQTPPVAAKVQDLTREGLAVLGRLLEEDQVASVLQHIQGYRPYVSEGPIEYYSVKDFAGAPFLIEAMTDEAVLSIAANYLSTPATIVDTALWKSSYDDGNVIGNQVFHRDRAGFKTCKLFIYLTDAEAKSGAHQYVLRSHDQKETSTYLAERGVSPSEVAAYFDGNARSVANSVLANFADRVFTVEGEAGEGFMTDNYGLHRGTPVETKPRWVFVAVYGSSDQRNVSAESLGSAHNTSIESLRNTSPQKAHALRLFGQA